MASSKKFKLVDTWEASTSQQPAETNWELHVICQEETAESVISPLLNQAKFDELGNLPRTYTELMKGKVLKQLWSPMWLSGLRHVDSVTSYNNQMLQRAQKREHESPERDGAPRKCSRLRSSQPSEVFFSFSVVKKLVP